MTLPGVSVLDVAYALAVAGVALIWPPLVLLVAACFFGLSAFLAYRHAPTPTPEAKP